jgi:hypothetical protein
MQVVKQFHARPRDLSRTQRPVDDDKVTIAVLLMIGRHADKPCPTRDDLIECTGLARRQAWRFVRQLQERTLIEIEERGRGKGRQRRMRVQGGPWTSWTQRREPGGEKPLLLAAMRA